MRRLLVMALVVTAGGAARAQPTGDEDTRPLRRGLMLELDGGFGATHLVVHDAPVELALRGVGIGGIDAGIGVFASQDLALLIRFSSETYFESQPTTNVIHAHSTLGPAAEWWFNDRFFAGAGLGLGIEGYQDQSGTQSNAALGYGVSARGGWALSVTQDAAWRVSVEGAAAFLISGDRAYSGTLLIGWQSF